MRIDGLKKSEVLQVLYNNASRAIGFGNDAGQYNMNSFEAEEEFESRPSGYFDYVRGRVLKVNLSGNVVDTFSYNGRNGFGKAERLIADLRAFKAAEAIEENRIT
jgi:hypothetical protein